ncbi:hypothetical protein AWB78_04912 [Caballeronia calidae]|uniref:Uncharacterized protein n=1 Tax=Caballeronia calidae TaxID=1777139 RepID=A0A158DAV2_9BURK|nr:hypothetical protein AWB78_04912 [Caballeronia calidae]
MQHYVARSPVSGTEANARRNQKFEFDLRRIASTLISHNRLSEYSLDKQMKEAKMLSYTNLGNAVFHRRGTYILFISLWGTRWLQVDWDD